MRPMCALLLVALAALIAVVGASPGRSFMVHDVTPAAAPPETISPDARFAKVSEELEEPLVQPWASRSNHRSPFAAKHSVPHSFVEAVVEAYAAHRPLVLRPDHFWLLIAQGVARHVASDNVAEAVRHKWVPHTGKKELVVEVLDCPWSGDDWAGIVHDFEAQIRDATVPGTVDDIVGSFSTTTPTDRVAGAAVAMSAAQHYFKYTVSITCGFPNITLLGTPEDWASLLPRAEGLLQRRASEEFTARWLPALRSVLPRIAATAAGSGPLTDEEVSFWGSLARYGMVHMCGANPEVDGWVHAFLPQTADGAFNDRCKPFTADLEAPHPSAPQKPDSEDSVGSDGRRWEPKNAIEVEDVPSGVVSAPVNFEGVPTTLRAGFVGVEVGADGTVSPGVGWFVTYASSTKHYCSDGGPASTAAAPSDGDSPSRDDL